MKSILRKVTVTDKETEWLEHKTKNKIKWLFNIAITKVMPEVESPEFGFGDNWSMYVTLQQRKITEKDGINYFPFRIVIKQDGKSLVSFVNIEECESYLKKHNKDALK